MSTNRDITPFSITQAVINGLSGNDVLDGGIGDDQLLGNTGNDIILGGSGIDTLGGGGGNDVLRGGTGNDVLTGGTGSDTLLGEAGNDNLNGQGAFDILIGGIGTDVQVGGIGSDLLIAGTTAYDNDDAQLAAIGAEWTSNRTYVERVNNLRNGSGTTGGGLNGTTFLTSTSVTNDSETDQLRGQRGEDWFWGDSTEVLDSIVLEFTHS